jgi:predicted nucleic-acid-binding protein
MLAIDTNVVIRFLTRDHEAQARRALEIVRNNDVFVAVTVILESEWVLRDAYEIPQREVVRELRRFCGLERVTVGAAEAVDRSLDLAETGIDFADALHLMQVGDCESLVTFDKRLARRARTIDGVVVRPADAIE